MPQGWVGLLSLAISAATFILYVSGLMHRFNRERYTDTSKDLDRCREELARLNEEIRDLKRINDRLMRRISLRDEC